jgi:acetoin utilization deacetylase AcuC-like enzyme
MRPHRVRLTHSLVTNYGLNSKMYVHRPQPRSKEEIEEFHCDGESRSWNRTMYASACHECSA